MLWKQYVEDRGGWVGEGMHCITNLHKLATNLERALASERTGADARSRRIMRARALAFACRRLNDFDAPESGAWVHALREIANTLVEVFGRTLSSVPGSLIERQ